MVAGLATGALALPGASPVQAADSNGGFAIDGAGLRTCSDFSEAIIAKDARLLAFSNWTEGFLSGVNVLRTETFDITPFEPIELIMAKMAKFCVQYPDQPYVQGVGQLVRALAPRRIKEQDEVVRFDTGQNAVFIYREMLTRVRERLKVDGVLTEDVPDISLSPALRTWQKQEGLDQTGLPDVATLNRMFP